MQELIFPVVSALTLLGCFSLYLVMGEMQKDLLNTEVFVFDGYFWVCGLLFASSCVVWKEGGFKIYS